MRSDMDRTAGVITTSVGYVGGEHPHPTYESVCRQRNDAGHTEAVRVVFDPDVISFAEIMDRFFADATPNIRRVQYRSAVWAQSPEQALIASQVARDHGKEDGVPIFTDAATWFDAEDYHQKYYEKMAAPRVCSRL